MSGQLSLRLEAAVPHPPTTLRPMLDRPLAEPFDSPSHVFEPIWGGIRALAIVGPAAAPGGGEVTLVGEDARSIPTPIDLAGLGARIAARSAVLDGEIVVVDPGGRLDRAELERRLGGGHGRMLAYLAFDLLDLDGVPHLRMPLERRRQLLRRVLRPGDELVAVPAIAREGRALFDAVAGQGLAGVRARQLGSPYLPGVRSRLWLAIEAEPGDMPGDGPAAPAATTDAAGDTFAAPALALIQRLPFDEER